MGRQAERDENRYTCDSRQTFVHSPLSLCTRFSSGFCRREPWRGQGHSQSVRWGMLAWPPGPLSTTLTVLCLWGWASVPTAWAAAVGSFDPGLSQVQPSKAPVGQEGRRRRSADQIAGSLFEGWLLPLLKARDSGTGPCLTVTLSNFSDRLVQ